MNLLAYTKQLSEKIKFYDTLTKDRFFDMNMTNPFTRPVNLTIVWVDNKDCEDQD